MKHAATNSVETPVPGFRGAFARQSLWLLATFVTAAVALLFNRADAWGQIFREWTLGISPWLQAAVVALAMVVLCRLRDTLFPGTEGTGIPQTIAALKLGDHPARERVLSLRILCGKTLLLVFALLTGPTIGREGPSVHVGACAFHLASRLTRFPPHLAARGLVLAGGAAGIASSFNAPIAGIIFTFEEIGRSFHKENASVIVRTAALAAILCAAFLGDYIFYGKVAARLPSAVGWIAVPIIGLSGGVLGGLFAKAVLVGSEKITQIRRRRPWTVAVGLGLVLAGIGLASEGLSYGSGYPQAHAILIEGEEKPWWLFLAIASGSFFSLLSAIPGGLFDPSLSTGAALGQLVHPWVPGMSQQEVMLLFMASYFAGVTQSPITAAVIVLEMTSAHGATLPLLLAAMLAYEASRRVCPNAFYDTLAERFLDGIGAAARPPPVSGQRS